MMANKKLQLMVIELNSVVIKVVAVILIASHLTLQAQVSVPSKITVTPVAEGWANNSINAVVFRKNSLVSFKDTQYIAFRLSPYP